MLYKPPILFKSGHFNTIFRTLFTFPEIDFTRKRINTPDDDFIDLDMIYTGSKKLIIIFHGLEGSSRSKYVLSNAIYFKKHSCDICAVNLRGCSGEPNKLYSSYHSGKTEDVDTVINSVENDYKEIYLLGYSLGGNLVTKYGGEKGSTIHKKIKKIVAVSVPADLEESASEISKPQNYLYHQLFLKSLKSKLKQKIEMFPNSGITPQDLKNISTLKQFDDIYTSKANGFLDALDYWKKNSCKQFIQGIKIPTLMLNAKNDPFLGKKCYPFKEAEGNKYFTLETPRYGGHVGFNISFDTSKNNWLEKRIGLFIAHSESNTGIKQEKASKRVEAL